MKIRNTFGIAMVLMEKFGYGIGIANGGVLQMSGNAKFIEIICVMANIVFNPC